MAGEATTHTPGVWRDAITDEGSLVVRGNGREVAYVGDMETTDAEDHANARLLAAAPELLAALAALRAELAYVEAGLGTISPAVMRQADAALAKARTGEGCTCDWTKDPACPQHAVTKGGS